MHTQLSIFTNNVHILFLVTILQIQCTSADKCWNVHFFLHCKVIDTNVKDDICAVFKNPSYQMIFKTL